MTVNARLKALKEIREEILLRDAHVADEKLGDNIV